MNFSLFFLSESRGNQLLRYFPQIPQRCETPYVLTSAADSMSEKRIVLEVARGK